MIVARLTVGTELGLSAGCDAFPIEFRVTMPHLITIVFLGTASPLA